MSDNNPEDSSRPKNPSRRSFLMGLFSVFGDREEMGRLGREAGKAYSEMKNLSADIQNVEEEVSGELGRVVREVQGGVQPPLLAPEAFAAAEQSVQQIELELTGAGEDPVPLASSSENVEATTLLLQDISQRLIHIEDAIGRLSDSTSPHDQAEAKRWTTLRQRLWTILAGAGGALSIRTAEALYEGWVQQNLLPLLPDWVQRPWRSAVMAAENQPTSPLPTPPVSPPPTRAVAQPESPLAHPKDDVVGVWHSGVLIPEMVYVPAGWFLMGGDPQSDSDTQIHEMPQHRVWLSGYWIGKYVITNAQYQSFIDATSHAAPRGWDASRLPFWRKNYPAVNVSWHDAHAYCEWLTRALGQRYSLPTEAQWEKAARGTDGRIWPWGDMEPDHTLLNYDNNVGQPTAVGSYPTGASPYHALDMSGNVWEWVNDWYQSDYYATSPDTNPQGPAKGTYRVLRGGSFSADSKYVRASYRYVNNPEYWYDWLGAFRCVCS